MKSEKAEFEAVRWLTPPLPISCMYVCTYIHKSIWLRFHWPMAISISSKATVSISTEKYEARLVICWFPAFFFLCFLRVQYFHCSRFYRVGLMPLIYRAPYVFLFFKWLFLPLYLQVNIITLLRSIRDHHMEMYMNPKFSLLMRINCYITCSQPARRFGENISFAP